MKTMFLSFSGERERAAETAWNLLTRLRLNSIVRSFRTIIQCVEGADAIGRLPAIDEWESLAEFLGKEVPDAEDLNWRAYYELLTRGVMDLGHKWQLLLPRAVSQHLFRTNHPGLTRTGLRNRTNTAPNCCASTKTKRVIEFTEQ